MRYSVVAIVAFCVLAFVIRNLRRSPIGRRLLAVRSNERAAASLGVNVVGVKLYAFVLAQIIATCGAMLTVFRYPSALFSTFSTFSNITYAMEAVVGGIGFVSGAFAGALIDGSSLGAKFMTVLGVGQWIVFVGGALLLVTVLMNPDGLASSAAEAYRKCRERITRLARRMSAALEHSHRERTWLKLRRPSRPTLHTVSSDFGERVGPLWSRTGGKRGDSSGQKRRGPGDHRPERSRQDYLDRRADWICAVFGADCP